MKITTQPVRLPVDLDEFPEVVKASEVCSGLRHELSLVKDRIGTLSERQALSEAEANELAEQLADGGTTVATITAQLAATANKLSADMAGLEQQASMLERALSVSERRFMALAREAEQKAAEVVRVAYCERLRALADAMVSLQAAWRSGQDMLELYSTGPLKLFPIFITPCACYLDQGRAIGWIRETIAAGMLPAEYADKLREWERR